MRAAMLTLALCLCCLALTECQRRRIEGLPRLNFRPNFSQYSGYLTSTGNWRLFYWLVESSHAPPSAAPLVLWMNGGPGCSSVGGLLMTNGPFLANDRAELDRNEFAWNRLANLLYIDSPSGVGLSEPGPIDPSELNDQATTQLNLRALLHFYSLFPEYRGRPFYIAGESYAGIYIPLLASAIIASGQHPSLINLTGIAVGNGLHVPISDSALAETRQQLCDVMGMTFDNDTTMLGNLSINSYNVMQTCHDIQDSVNVYPCLNTTGLVTYLRDRRVRQVLGVLDSVPAKYVICNLLEIFDNYQYLNRDVLPELRSLMTAGISVLLYHGNLDYMIPTRVTQRLLEQLPRDAGTRGAWFYCHRAFGRDSVQIGGVQRSYMGGRLRYRSVIGAGHTVATDRPEAGFQIFKDFLSPDPSAGGRLPRCLLSGDGLPGSGVGMAAVRLPAPWQMAAAAAVSLARL